ncbi:MAG: tetratricopeptide repeat protein [Planctomycetes bacterium]|nr:tetratricopeptide repeat protein [Planctomycetota bacterium]
MNLVVAYVQAVRIPALLLVSEYLANNRRVPRLASALRNLRAPTVQSWLDVLHAFLNRRVDALGEKPWCAPILDSLEAAFEIPNDRPGKARRLVDALKELRNAELAHRADISDARARELYVSELPRVRSLLRALSALADVRLLRRVGAPEAEQFVELRGDAGFPNPQFLVQSGQPRALRAALAESGIVVEREGVEPLPLFPLFLALDVHESAPTGLLEPLEPAPTFDGILAQRVIYLGRSTRLERTEEHAAASRLFASKEVQLLLSHDEIQPWLLADWARESSAQRIESLARDGKYVGDAYQTRPGVEAPLERWLHSEAPGKPAALVVSDPGYGKTNLLCRLAARALASSQPSRPDTGRREEDLEGCTVLFVLGAEIRGADGLWQRVRQGLGIAPLPNSDALPLRSAREARQSSARGFRELLQLWQSRVQASARKPRMIWILDALNEGEDLKSLLEQLSELAAIARSVNEQLGYGALRILGSVRAGALGTLTRRWNDAMRTSFLSHPECFQTFDVERGGKRETQEYLELPPFSMREASAAYVARASWMRERGESPCEASWDSLSSGVQEPLRSPLMLALFHHAFPGQVFIPAILPETTLWDRYLAKSLELRPGLDDDLARVAGALLDQGSAQISPDRFAAIRDEHTREKQWNLHHQLAFLSPVESLEDAGMLRREGSGWVFTNQTLSEIVLAREIRRRDPGLKAETLDEYGRTAVDKAYPELRGALVHLVMIWWEADRMDDLRSLSLTAMSLPWYQVIYEALLRTALEACERGEESVSRWGLRLGKYQDLEPSPVLAVRSNLLLWRLDPALSTQMGTSRLRRSLLEMCARGWEALARSEPDRADFQRDLSVSYNKLGDLMRALGQGDQAKAFFEKALQIAERLARSEPDRADFQRDLSVSYNQLGDLMRALGQGDQAKTFFEKCHAILKRLARSEPDRADFQRDLSVSYNQLGDLMRALGQGDQAKAFFEKALQIAERLARSEPDRADFQRDLSVSYNKLGDLMRALGQGDQAKAFFEKCHAILERLARSEPDRADFQRDLIVSHVKNAESDPYSAAAHYQSALEIARRLRIQGRHVEGLDRLIPDLEFRLSFVSAQS